MGKKLKCDDKLYRSVEGMLYNYKNLKAQIKNIELDIEEKLNNYDTLSAVQYDKDAISKTNKFNSEVENKVISLDKDGVDEEIKFLIAKKKSREIQVERIDNMLSVLNDFESKLIIYRYFEGLQFKDIVDKLFKSESYLQKKRREIIINKFIPLIK